MFKTLRFISILGVCALILSACNLPAGTPTPDSANVVFTAAALTVQAQLNQTAVFNTPTLPPPQATNTQITIPTAVIQTVTPIPAISPTPLCDLALFVSDQTIPDGTNLAPGQVFKKTWRLRNIGTCTWSGYTLVFDSGEAMSPVIDPIGNVATNQEVDVSVTFTAPVKPGHYRSYWRLRNTSNAYIPVQLGWENKGFFVDFNIGSSGYDFHTKASSAIWKNGTSTAGLTFGTDNDTANGFAIIKDGQKFEDGTFPAKVLETYPQQVVNGVIAGRYPAYTVALGEFFTAKIGFLMKSDGTCGAGNVKFQLNYYESAAGPLKPLGEWVDTCTDASLKPIKVDLSSLAGKAIEFELRVIANNNPATDNWAVWIAPQIAIP